MPTKPPSVLSRTVCAFRLMTTPSASASVTIVTGSVRMVLLTLGLPSPKSTIVVVTVPFSMVVTLMPLENVTTLVVLSSMNTSPWRGVVLYVVLGVVVMKSAGTAARSTVVGVRSVGPTKQPRYMKPMTINTTIRKTVPARATHFRPTATANTHSARQMSPVTLTLLRSLPASVAGNIWESGCTTSHASTVPIRYMDAPTLLPR
mmetsp:Transcript_10336/g.24988  ORF Transcript_10336/g.24988 Transcript_10336/m.24988 type:complete len:204 (-) Transcript_10336:332-943(-)